MVLIFVIAGNRFTKMNRLTYNCAHLRSRKESLTIEYKEIILDVLGEIFLVKNFCGENFLAEIFFV